jgi:ABC-type glycerol-3-phosphate transport system permease component
MKTTIDQIPVELEEAARVDGASIRQISAASSCRSARKE